MRIVTYNTRGSLGMDNKRSTQRIIETLRPLSADIVCFQEIHRRLPWSGREDQPEVLEHGLNREFIFQSNVNYLRGGYGIGIALRGVIVERKEHPLPSMGEQRGALEVRVRDFCGFKQLTIFCTHWGLKTDERLKQAEALSNLVLSAGTPVILCGDLNEGPQCGAVRHLLAATGLKDVGAAQNRMTFLSDNPIERIDYILHSPELTAQYSEIIESLASDHLPLLADIEPADRKPREAIRE